MHRVLKAFPCSFDGINSIDLKPGDERDFGGMAAGLKQAGLIGDIASAAPPAEPHPLDHDADGRKGGSKPKKAR